MESLLMLMLFSVFMLFPMIIGEPEPSRIFGPGSVSQGTRGEYYAWGLLLLVLSSETEAAACKESAKGKNDERLTAQVG